MQELLASLDQIQAEGQFEEDDLVFLRNFFQRSDFLSLLALHKKIVSAEIWSHDAVTSNVVDISVEVQQSLMMLLSMPEAVQLLNILTQPHVKAFLRAHDQVARREFEPTLADVPHEVDEDDQCVTIVCLVKSEAEPLGATIQRDEKLGTIKIVRVLRGGAADRCGMVHVGDELHEVNNVCVAGMSPDDVVTKLFSAVGEITLKLVSDKCRSDVHQQSQMWVRANFDYDPQRDSLIPCPQAGLAFRRGDVLHIVCSSDALWWQARKAHDTRLRAGLIPSRQLQQRKEAMRQRKQTLPDAEEGSRSLKGGKVSPLLSSRLTRRLRRPKTTTYLSNDNDGYGAEEMMVYEDVSLYQPPTGQYRPIVLVGLPAAGCAELSRTLVSSQRGHFKLLPRYTSRPRGYSEEDADEFVFMSRDEMKRDRHRYVDCHEEDGHLYAMSRLQLGAVIQAGHVAVLCPKPQALKQLCVAEFMPYVICIMPPPGGGARGQSPAVREAQPSGSTTSSRPETDLEKVIQSAVEMERIYGHYFHETIINDNRSTTVTQLESTAERLETEPMWVSSGWTMRHS